jgi:small subunit ribosomal protein S2e
MADSGDRGRGGFGRGFGGRGDRGRGDRGRGRGRRGRKEEEEKWVPCTKLGRLVQQVRTCRRDSYGCFQV